MTPLVTRQLRRLAERKPWAVVPRRTRYGQTTHTYLIDKHPINEETGPVYSVNKRTMAKKAWKAFKKNKNLYKYKNEFFVVPRVATANNDKDEEE